MWRHSCFATVHDCPYWQLFSGAWHFAQCRKNRSHLSQVHGNHTDVWLTRNMGCVTACQQHTLPT